MGGGGSSGGKGALELRLRSCRIRVDFGFPAAVCTACLWGDRELLLRCLAVCMLHELGHGLTMLLTHAGIREVRFYAAGMQMVTHTACLSAAQRLCIALSGPAVNLVCAAVLRQCSPELAALHLCMGCFNLLPYRVLDGGTALDCLLGEHPRVMCGVRIACVCLSAAAVVLLRLYGVHNPVLYLMAVYLAAAELIDKSGGVW